MSHQFRGLHERQNSNSGRRVGRKDGLLVTFSDGITGGYVIEELLKLRPVRERMRIKKGEVGLRCVECVDTGSIERRSYSISAGLNSALAFRRVCAYSRKIDR